MVLGASDKFIMVRDLAENKFRFHCHTSTLRLFIVAIRQRQLQLGAMAGISADFRSAADRVVTATKDVEDEKIELEKGEWEALALCLYHYLKIEFYKHTIELRDMSHDDHEDGYQKNLRVLRLKQPIAAGCLCIVANLGGYKVQHQAFALLPAEALYGVRSEFDAGALKKFSVVAISDRKVQTAKDIEDPPDGEWRIAVDLLAPPKGPMGVASQSRLDLRVEVKSRSMVSPTVAMLQMKLPPLPEEEDDILGPITVGEWVLLQGHVGHAPLPRDPKTLAIGPPVREGPQFSESLINPPAAPPTEHTVSDGAEAAVVFDFEEAGKVRVNQDHFARDGKFSVFCFGHASAKPVKGPGNPAELTTKSVEYRFGQTGDWVKGKSRIGLCFKDRMGWPSYHFSDTSSLTIDETAPIALRLEFEVEGKPGSDNQQRARLPAQFTELPLFIRHVVEDSAGATHTLTFAVTNPPPDVKTREQVQKDCGDDKELLAFVTADDTGTATRAWAAAYISAEDGADGVKLDDMELHVKRPGVSVTYGLPQFEYVAYQAAKTGNFEQPMDHFDSTPDSGHRFQGHILVSADYPPQVYAIRLKVWTDTSSSTEEFHIRFPGTRWIATKLPPAAPAAAPAAEIAAAPAAPPAEPRAPQPSAQQQATGPAAAGDAAATANDASPTHADPNASGSTAAALGGRSGSMASAAGYTVMYNERLGQGANGAVFRGYDNAQGQFVAVKESLIAENMAMREALVKEFSTLTNLKHPNIVTVHALEIDGPVCRVFMEWLPSGSLSHVVRQTRHRMHEAAIRRYFRDALKGLAFLHERGLCHLDIKPANMLLTADGTVKLADFGTSRILGPASTGGATVTNLGAVGTPVYMPPEMITNGKYFEGSDMWALACSIIELATGQLPWHDLVPVEILCQAIPLMFFIASARPPNHHPTVPSHLSSTLQKILQRCFNATIASRPTARALLDDEYFTSDCLPLDAEDEQTFAKVTVAAANIAHSTTASGSVEAADPSSWTVTSSGPVVVSAGATTLGSTASQ